MKSRKRELKGLRGQWGPNLDFYPAGGRVAVIVCPGGAYAMLAPHEGEPVARFFQSEGYPAFVLHYRVAPWHYPAPQMDLMQALCQVKKDYDKVVVVGFSAGAHLAASTALYRREWPPGIGPDALVLGYPVVSFVENAHDRCVANLAADEPELMEKLSLERHMTADFPPTYFWHTREDTSVPVEHAFMLNRALERCGVFHCMDLYDAGRHGLGLARGYEAEIWPREALRFLRDCGCS